MVNVLGIVSRSVCDLECFRQLGPLMRNARWWPDRFQSFANQMPMGTPIVVQAVKACTDELKASLKDAPITNINFGFDAKPRCCSALHLLSFEQCVVVELEVSPIRKSGSPDVVSLSLVVPQFRLSCIQTSIEPSLSRSPCLA